MDYEEVDYEEYEKKCDKIREDNEKYLIIFENDLESKGLSRKTINSHVSNADFYINAFLLYYDPVPMKNGYDYIDSFLGNYFIRKCMWSTPGTIKTTAASIKRFYKCMLDKGEIYQSDYDELCEIIKSDMEEWQDTCRRFNDLSEENPFAPFFDE